MQSKYTYLGRLDLGDEEKTAKEFLKDFSRKLKHYRNILRLWNQRRRQRRELKMLSDFMLKDIGISRVDALQEAEKPFWKS